VESAPEMPSECPFRPLRTWLGLSLEIAAIGRRSPRPGPRRAWRSSRRREAQYRFDRLQRHQIRGHGRGARGSV